MAETGGKSGGLFETDDPKIEAQYGILSIIDGKAETLLAFNGLLLAAISVWLGNVPLNFLHLILDLIFLAVLWSCILVLESAWLHRTKANTEQLTKVPDERTACIRKAWRVSMRAVYAISAVTIVHTAGTALTVAGACQSGLCKEFYSEKFFGNLDHTLTTARAAP